ncbi:hypothetical protein JAAARDRAFT_35953 [Jaapia argillacea MUCL 33604]|uniref:Altered inheritance of mitochondria protein 9, mitochondrial n=1 Tax=Jaapia argillacea MUCL 33604 TaxID=933084 RepID=A0A067PR85_9AGAM|nr:hypothetical protein JAAARDRAFT_35953 [Jaapia argillacea MUCL 33604]
MSSNPLINFGALRDIVAEKTDVQVKTIDLIGKDEVCKIYHILLENNTILVAKVAVSGAMSPIFESEVATINYIKAGTSLPVPTIIAFDTSSTNGVGPYIITEKIIGVNLESMFSKLTPFQRHAVVAQIAEWMIELSHHRFEAIGGLVCQDSTYYVGPATGAAFFVDGRANLPLDRGPFTTARAYYQACAQRELDCSRVFLSQDTSLEYQRHLEDSRVQVERSVSLMLELISRCPDLDEDPPSPAPFGIDLHSVKLKDLFVTAENPSRIICVDGWQGVATGPLWRCARLPRWLRPSISDEHIQEQSASSFIFKQKVQEMEGSDSSFLRALDNEDTRHALDDISGYDAFKDGFLLLPTLESMLATLPGEEDVDGLSAMLDPATLVGRVARINLVTRGSNAMFLAMPGGRGTMNRSEPGTPPIISV